MPVAVSHDKFRAVLILVLASPGLVQLPRREPGAGALALHSFS